MDTAIANGDFKIDGRGRPEVISGFEEVLQRVMIRVKTRRSSFIYDRELGSDIEDLKSETENLNDKALAIVRRAVANMSKIEISKAEVTKESDNQMIIRIEVKVEEEVGEVELII